MHDPRSRILPPPYELRLERAAGAGDPYEQLRRTHRDRCAILLDSGGDVEAGRWSILALDPCEVHAPSGSELARAAASGGLGESLGFLEAPERPFARIRGDARGRLDELPFVGGWLGCLDYELGHVLAPRPLALDALSLRRSLAWFGFFPRGWIWDRRERRAYRFELTSCAASVDRLRTVSARPPGDVVPCPPIEVPARFLRAVERVREWIAAGDVYQVNVSRRQVALALPDPLALYGHLRDISPAPYGAYLRLPGRTILSNSPELFFEVHGDRLVAAPVKGTRPRAARREVDEAARRELQRSEKDRAELVMIVDLYRNDLGRIARAGSVEVPHGIEVRSYANVHHQLAEVRARRRTGTSFLDLLLALYPAGSITGAPKLRAQEIIQDLERGPRGIYTGSIAAVDVRGRAALSVAIRTGEDRGAGLELRMGAGIVIDSDPREELDEVEAKGASWMRALRACGLSAAFDDRAVNPSGLAGDLQGIGP